MKELSVEEKAKAYDEAFKEASVAHKDEDRHLKAALERIFPELKESENERTWIINYLHNRELNSSIIAEKVNLKKAIAWLEKQSESSDKIHYWTEEEIEPIISDYLRGAEHYGGMIGRLRCLRPKSLEKQGEQKPAWSEDRSKELSLSLQIQAYLSTASDELYAKGKPLYSEKRIEDIHKCMLMWQKLHNAYFYQKPAWSEEDEMIALSIEQVMNCASLLNIVPEKVDKIRTWLKSLKDRVQPKQEWSEEDNETLDRIISNYQYFCKELSLKDGLTEVEKEVINNVDKEDINWLKSLRPQNTWKPSDEQIKVCKEVYADILSAKGFNLGTVNSELNRLEEELKKLREE